MESHFSTGRTLSAFDTHFEGSFTAYAEFEFTLCAGEMHTSTFGQGVAKFATCVWIMSFGRVVKY